MWDPTHHGNVILPRTSSHGGGDGDQRTGEVTGRTIDRECRHQVALPADQVMEPNYKIIRDFHYARVALVRRDNVDYLPSAFADPAYAERLLERFGGERIAPKRPHDKGAKRPGHRCRYLINVLRRHECGPSRYRA
jgi:hypothetical protein